VPFNHGEDSGCAYPLAEGVPPASCGATRRPGSSFCAEHHALCHVSPGSWAEDRELAEEEALARAVGGRLGGDLRAPPEALLRRLDRISRLFFCPESSRYVHSGGGNMPRRIVKRPETGEQSGDLGPTPERLQHGPVEALPRAIADSLGRLSRPYRAVDTLQIMERRGSITPAMRQAGEDFRARFTVAQLDPLRASDQSHLRIAEEGPRPDKAAPGPRAEAARATVWRAVQAVGGIGSPAGSCLWHVVGWQLPLKEWALGQGWSGRRVSQEAASGILIAALGALESHLDAPKFLR
jgi:hypothetical protein